MSREKNTLKKAHKNAKHSYERHSKRTNIQIDLKNYFIINKMLVPHPEFTDILVNIETHKNITSRDLVNNYFYYEGWCMSEVDVESAYNRRIYFTLL